MHMENKLLDVRSLSIGFRSGKETLSAVRDVSFSLERGRTLCIVGESGCGKSVSVSTILRLLPKKATSISGEILFNGKDLLKMSAAELDHVRGNDISMIFQEPMTSLNPTMTIGKQLMEGLLAHQTITRKEAYERCEHMLASVNIHDPKRRMKEYPHQFSGGMRQRVMIAMAMLCNPSVLIADEPTTALDVTVQAQILELMEKLKEEHNTAILFITHDMGVVAELADDVIVMYAGEMVECRDVNGQFTTPRHPYTQGLLSALPRIGQDQHRLYSIEGTVPALGKMSDGCRFADRCTQRMPECVGRPAMYDTGDARVKCFRYRKEGE